MNTTYHIDAPSISSPRRGTQFLIVLGAAVILSAGLLRADELIKNGGFEDGSSGWWGPGLKSGGVVSDQAGGGANCLNLSEGFVCQDKRPVEGGKSYKISMKIRSESAPEGSVYVQVSFRGEGVKPGWYGAEVASVEGRSEKALFVTGGTQEWKEYTSVIDAPANATEMLIYLRKLGGTAGTASFDDVKIEPAN
ncbi:hypothetical protein DB345_05315 [Spartobacteria bacterium LR76]|nr:hypothetical protein DB345_05315 [Spartobacteria bacterium LR76]